MKRGILCFCGRFGDEKMKKGSLGFGGGLRISFVFSFVFSFSGLASAASLDQLAAMQTLVRVEIDGTPVCQTGASSSVLTLVPMLLEARVREELDSLSVTAKKDFFSGARVAACAVKCRCGIYAGWILEGESGLASVRTDLLKRDERARGKAEGRLACAKANRDWVCKHPVFRKVIQDAKRNGES